MYYNPTDIFIVFFLCVLVQWLPVNAWNTISLEQSLFPSVTLDTLIVFIPEKNSEPNITISEAKQLTNSIFSPSGYGLSTRYNEYSSGSINMTGLVDSGDTYVSVKYIEKGVDSCDRGTIIDGVYADIDPIKPSRLIVVQNTRKPECSGYADNSGTVTMVWTLDALNPHVLFHELGHSLSFPHPATSVCYSKKSVVTMSNNCTSVDGDNFQNMGVISHDQPWYKANSFKNVATNISGIMEYSSYNRLSSTWPMLKESNVFDIAGNGTFKIFNSETSSIGNKTATLRIPLNPPIKISDDIVSTNTTYHTHYYVDFTQRRPNTDEGGLYNYVIIRSAPDHRSKHTYVTRFLTALSQDDTSFNTTFFDNYRGIRINLTSISDDGATVNVTFPPTYSLSPNVNQCYFSAVINSTYAVTVNDNNICRGLSRDNLPSTGTFNGTHCLIPYSNIGHIVPLPNLEFLHCLNTPEWITLENSTMDSYYDIWNKSDMFVCKAEYEGDIYQGRGAAGECCFYYNDGEHCVRDDPTIVYLSWLSF